MPYMDDVLVASKNEEEHISHLRILYKRFQDQGIRINPSKCNFGKSQVNFLGYKITEKGIQPMEDKISSIVNFPKPSTVQEMRRFLAMMNFYRRFIPHAASTQAPLFYYLKGAKKKDKRPIVWTVEAEEAFQQCKNDLANAATLVHPSSYASISLTVDASDTTIGGVLRQSSSNGYQLAFFSRKLSTAEKSTVVMTENYLQCTHPLGIFVTCWKDPEAFPIQDITAETVARALYENWICRFGAPSKITTDQGKQFESHLFKSLAALLGTETIRTSPYRPSSNGIIERIHRNLKSSIRCHADQGWADALPTVLMGWRTTYREDLEATPAQLTYGTNIRLPGECFVENKSRIDQTTFVGILQHIMHKLRPVPSSSHNRESVFIHKDLPNSSHVFVGHNGVRRRLQSPYQGPLQSFVDVRQTF
ncbi:Transposon Tf2-6 polyprotein [Araneus ventricosus]|uniref:RNA-directed DNA polymerase n=1 Tax=Araneus ventricosus TaxID=182803 RepID=A0A4Y2SNZ5_ARAVE|nr:Transposon Tf2-6 polyprotein [Araneus ventricosus]